MRSPIEIKLTRKQLKELKPIFVLAYAECAEGKKGMVIGQAYPEEEGGILRIGFVPNRVARKLVYKGPRIEN